MQLNNVGLILMRRQALRHVVVVVVAGVVATCCSITLLFAIPCLLSELSSSQLGHATFAFAHAHFPYSRTPEPETEPRTTNHRSTHE